MATGNAFVRDVRKAFEIFVFAAGAVVMTAAAIDAARGADPGTTQTAEREVIPGADRMTSAERDAYRRRMEAAATP